MDLEDFVDTPPWEWPSDAGKVFLEVLTDKRAKESDRLVAAELAGDLVAMNDELAEALLAIVGGRDEPKELRGRAAISLGPALEQADMELLGPEGFEDPEAVPITEHTFHKIQDSLHKLYLDESIPKKVRRGILEGSVRAPQDWHKDAIMAAYSSGDRDWRLTAVFSMRWVGGFDKQILEALESADPEIHCEAVSAAGNQELDAAWSHVVALVEDPGTPKPLLLAAIEALGAIRPREAGPILADLTDSDDEEIVEAVEEAMAMAQAMSGEADPGIFENS